MSLADSKRVYQKATHCIFDNDGTLMGKLLVRTCLLYSYYTSRYFFRYRVLVQQGSAKYT